MKKRLSRIATTNQYIAHLLPKIQDLHIGPVCIEVGYHVFSASHQHQKEKTHRHLWWDVSMVREGSIHYQFDKGTARPKRNSIMVFPNGVEHSWRIPSDGFPLVMESFMLTVSSIKPAGKEIISALRKRAEKYGYCFELGPQLMRRRQELWDTLISDVQPSLKGTRIGILLQLFVTELFADIYENEFTAVGQAFLAEIGQLDHDVRLAVQMQEFLCGHLDEKITMERMQHQFGYSERHLSRIFRNQTSVTVQEFLRDKRLKTACDLLANTDLRTGEIAVRAGFENSSYFCKIFREHKHFTPKQYRTAYRK